MRAPLSNASPAASSSVCAEHARATTARPPGRGTCGRRWPPGRGTAARSGRSPSVLATTWPCRWFTGRERQAARGGQRLGARHAHEQRADQPRAAGHGHRLDVVERCAGALEGIRGHGVDQLQVAARGDLRHHAAVALVQQPLRSDHVRAAPRRPRLTSGGAGVVAARLDRRGSRVRRASAWRRVHGLTGGRGAPHDQGVLPVVVVVAAPASGGAEAEALVEADRAVVRGPDLERVLLARAGRRVSNSRVRSERGDAAPAQAVVAPPRSSRARRCRSASRPGSPPAAPRASPPGRCPTAWTARARTSPATRAWERHAARWRSPAAGRRR